MRAEAFLLALVAAGCSATRSLETGVAAPARQIRGDARSTWEILAGGPRWIARDAGRDWAALRSTFARAGEDLGRDARETLGHVTGFPDWVARDSARDLRRLRFGLSEMSGRFEEDLDRGAAMATGVPRWLATEWEEGTSGLGWLLDHGAARARQDAREFPGALADFFWTGLW